MKIDLFEGLNEAQTEAVLHKDGPCLVAATAGAGKTRTVVHRCAHLVQEHKVNPERILCLSFTRAAADEMTLRFKSLCPGVPFEVRTFHSLAYGIWMEQRPNARKWELDSTGALYKYLAKIAIGSEFLKLSAGEVDLDEILTWISYYKAHLVYPETEREERTRRFEGAHIAPPPRFDQVYEMTEEILYRIQQNDPHFRRAHMRTLGKTKPFLTFDDMLAESVLFLESYEDARRTWAAKWDYIIQDEAQDQNLARLLLGELLARDHRNYMLVGDSAQAIFTWNGARPDRFLSFPGRWDAKVIEMRDNYRSCAPIIDVANAALRKVEGKLEGFQMRGHRDDGGLVRQIFTDENNHLADEIAVDIAEQINDYHRKPSDFAVLVRMGSQLQPLIERLHAHNVPFYARGGGELYKKKPVRALMGYTRMILGRLVPFPEFQAACQMPLRYLSAKAIEEAYAELRRSGWTVGSFQYLFQNFGDTSYQRRNFGALGSVVDFLRPIAGVQAEKLDEFLAARDKLDDYEALSVEEQDSTVLSELKQRFNELQTAYWRQYSPASFLTVLEANLGLLADLSKREGKGGRQSPTKAAVGEFIRGAQYFRTNADHLEYIDKIQTAIRAAPDARRAVTVTTIHQAKGLEWPVVYVYELNEGLFPISLALSPAQYQEERRLFYVALTRARDELVLTGWTGEEMRPSHFLAGLNLDVVDDAAE